MKYPERILIVLKPDGSLKVAQMEQLELSDDGRPLKQHPAEELTAEALAFVLPSQAELLATLDRERKEAARVKDAATRTLRDELAQKRSEIAALSAAVSVYAARLAALEGGNG